MQKRVWMTAIVLLAVVAAIFAFRSRPTEAFQETKRLQSELLETGGRMTPAEQAEGWRTVKQRWSTFTEAERQELMQQHEEHQRSKLARFSQLQTEEERNAFLDAELEMWAVELNRKRPRGKEMAAEQNGSEGPATSQTKADKGKDLGGKDLAEWKEAKERHYVDSTTPELRAYHVLLKQRWYEKYGKP